MPALPCLFAGNFDSGRFCVYAFNYNNKHAGSESPTPILDPRASPRVRQRPLRALPFVLVLWHGPRRSHQYAQHARRPVGVVDPTVADPALHDNIARPQQGRS